MRIAGLCKPCRNAEGGRKDKQNVTGIFGQAPTVHRAPPLRNPIRQIRPGPIHDLLPWVTIAFGLGIAVVLTSETATIAWRLAAGVPGIGLAALLLVRRPAGHAPRILLLLALFFLLGAAQAGPSRYPPEDPAHIANLLDSRKIATVSGRLLESPVRAAANTRLLMEVETILLPADRNSAGRRTNGRIRLTMEGEPPADLIPGRRFMAQARLSPVFTFTAPGVFNYQRYLHHQGIRVIGWIDSPLKVLPLPALPAPAATVPPAGWRFAAERYRHRIIAFIDQTLEQPTRGLYKAILTGDRADIAPEILEHFMISGCIHILAISGMHMGLIGVLAIGCLDWLLRRSTWLILHVNIRKTAALLSLVPLTFYALIAGFNIPVVRALIMAAIFILTVFLDQQRSVRSSIALAALLILIWQPPQLLTASFQLSFGAVIAIAALYPVMLHPLSRQPGHTLPAGPRERPGRWQRWLYTALAVSLAAVIGTAPLLVYHFNRLSLISPLANLIVEPLICFWSLTLGLIASLLIPWVPDLAALLLRLGGAGLIAADLAAAFLGTLPAASLWLPTPGPTAIAGYYGIIFWLLHRFKRDTGNRFGLQTALAVPMLILLLAGPSLGSLAPWRGRSTTVTILDVGQGSATVLELPQGRTILLDGGGSASPAFNVGERVIAPFLWKRGIRKVEAIVVSHPDSDHYNGLLPIIERFRPRTLWINGQPGQSPLYGVLLAKAEELQVEVRIAGVGEVLSSGGGARLVCLAGPEVTGGMNAAADGGSSEEADPGNSNEGSLVLRLDQRPADGGKGVSFLFPADIEARTIKRLMETPEIDVDMLLAPHHGCGSSHSRDFLAAASPRLVAVSAGRFNSFNCPDPNLARDCRDLGIEYATTVIDGTITLTTDGDSLDITRYQVNR